MLKTLTIEDRAEQVDQLEKEVEAARKEVEVHPRSCSCTGCARMVVLGAELHQAKRKLSDALDLRDEDGRVGFRWLGALTLIAAWAWAGVLG